MCWVWHDKPMVVNLVIRWFSSCHSISRDIFDIAYESQDLISNKQYGCIRETDIMALCRELV